MGPADAVPELPALEMALVPASHRYVSKKWQDCNWVQALEGSIDTAHFTFAHLSFDKDEDEVLDIQEALRQSDRAHERRSHALDRRGSAPRDKNQSALMRDLTIAGGRLTDGDNIYWRIAQFLMRCTPMRRARCGREYLWPEFCARHRHQLLDLHLCLESGAATDPGRARQL